jgi:hypothetical protein
MRYALATLVTLALGCGGGSTCQTASCGAKSYDTCATPGSAVVEYRFGGESCSCNAGTTDCLTCTEKLTTYCGGGGGTTGMGVGGNGGTGGSGGGGGTIGGGGGTGGSGGGGTTGGGSGGSGGGPGSLCALGGTSCQSFSDCCSGTCANQVCTSCNGAGGTCFAASDCCLGASCYNGTCVSACAIDGGKCTLATDCCSGICGQGTCRQCTTAGNSCTSSSECCGGLECNGGTCYAPATGCSGVPQTCISCCSTNYSAGYMKLVGLEATCACTKGSTCLAACSVSLCAGATTPDSACATCLGQSCSTMVLQQCQADTDCAAYIGCAAKCPTM